MKMPQTIFTILIAILLVQQTCAATVCENVASNLICSGVSKFYTSVAVPNNLPNSSNADTQVKASQKLTNAITPTVLQFLTADCSSKAQATACAVLFPECQTLNGVSFGRSVCREACLEVRTSCGAFAVGFPQELNCDLKTDSGAAVYPSQADDPTCVYPSAAYPGLKFDFSGGKSGGNATGTCPENMIPSNKTGRPTCEIDACGYWMYSESEVEAFNIFNITIGTIAFVCSIGVIVSFLFYGPKAKWNTARVFPFYWSISAIIAIIGLVLPYLAGPSRVACDADGTSSTGNPKNGNALCTITYFLVYGGAQSGNLWYTAMTVYLFLSFRSMASMSPQAVNVALYVRLMNFTVWPFSLFMTFLPIFASRVDGTSGIVRSCTPSMNSGALFEFNSRVKSLLIKLKWFTFMITATLWPQVIVQYYVYFNTGGEVAAAEAYFQCRIQNQNNPAVTCPPLKARVNPALYYITWVCIYTPCILTFVFWGVEHLLPARLRPGWSDNTKDSSMDENATRKSQMTMSMRARKSSELTPTVRVTSKSYTEDDLHGGGASSTTLQPLTTNTNMVATRSEISEEPEDLPPTQV
eukprot:Colp12_sorted_trinity150504_noHs@20521